MSDIALIGCSMYKRAHPAPAMELYNSPLFKLAFRYCSQHYDQLFIISAKYGLVRPEQIIRPYNLLLCNMSSLDRRKWGKMVRDQLKEIGLLEDGNRFLVYAGSMYVRVLKELFNVEEPLQGLGIGERKQWFRGELSAIKRNEGFLSDFIEV